MDRRDFLQNTFALSAVVAAGQLLVSTPAQAEDNKAVAAIKSKHWQYDLQLKHTWTIARGSRDTATVTFFEIESEGVKGIGEAALSTAARYGETRDTVQQALSQVDLSAFSTPFQYGEIFAYIERLAPGQKAARAAIDIAIHDWLGKKLNVPLYRLWGLNKDKTPLSTFTIAIDTPEIMMRKTEEAAEFPVLKIKVGRENDEEIIAAIRKVTDKPLRVDANEGWKSKEAALERIKWLQDQGVELIEQPLPTSQLAETAWLRERVNIPLFADESVSGLGDIGKLHDAFDGINIKLMKCGGLGEALKMIHTARALGMKIMMGCMIESSVGISAAAQLSPLIDYADLDGNLLVSNDPYTGVKVVAGKIVLPDDPGIGVKLR
jgi:L-alanine-DL-glutamate epimerase-like enolase superfamily enzyme